MTSHASRRQFFASLGAGLGSVALASMSERDAVAAPGSWAAPDGRPHFAPRAKSVIWLFMAGGASQTETFDPKPALNRYAGMTIAETAPTQPAGVSAVGESGRTGQRRCQRQDL